MLFYSSQFIPSIISIVIWLFTTELNKCTPLYPESLALPELTFQSRSSNYSDDIARATVFLRTFDKKAETFQVKSGEADWKYETEITDEHLKEVLEIGEEVSSFYIQSSINASKIQTLDLPDDLSRAITLIKRSSEPSQKELRMDIKKLIGEMTKIYSQAKVQKHDEKLGVNVNLTQAELSKILKTSRDIKELNWAWKMWRGAVGPTTKRRFSSLVDLLNIGAREHGWIDYGDYLRREYEMSDLEENLDQVWTEIEPLYRELHGYVRHKLSHIYNISKNGCIPASILGDLYAQDWENTFELVQPTEKSKTFDVTQELKKQKYTVKKIFKLAESFFTSIGLDPMPDSFWNRSVLTKSKDKEMVCHASAWDIGKKDVRIKMCTEINQKDLTTVHHEMGHIEYFLAYTNQPTTFRAGANPGFHEAIGDTISLSVETPAYLKKVGLLKNSKMQEDDKISFLLNQALRRVAPIPYNLLVDKWRWRVFEGNITEETYNKAWWNLRVKYQGVEPPLLRPEDAFDPASKYHIGANVPYIPYFFSYVLQFQLQKKLCTLAGHKGPLYACSIQNSKEAGSALRKLLAAGRSHPWPKLLQTLSGEKTLKADAILEYFQPLKEWLHSQRKKEKYQIGWKDKSGIEVLDAVDEKFVIDKPQERSGISKSREDDKATLSFNIPPDALKALLKNAQYGDQNTTSSTADATADGATNNTAQIRPLTLVDLSKLLKPANQLSIKSSESSDNDSDGHKNAVDINTGNTVASEQNKTTNSEGDGTPPESLKNNAGTISIDKEALISKLGILLKTEKENGTTAAQTETNENNVQTTLKNDSTVASLQPENVEKLTGLTNAENLPSNTTPIASQDIAGNSGTNQIALVPVSIPTQVLSALQNPQYANQSAGVAPLKETGTSLTNGGNLNIPYDPKQEKKPSEDSKLYSEKPPENSTLTVPTSVSREELLKILQTTLANKANERPVAPLTANAVPVKTENNADVNNATNSAPQNHNKTLLAETLMKEIKKLKMLSNSNNAEQNPQSGNLIANIPSTGTIISNDNNKINTGNRAGSNTTTASDPNKEKNTDEEITSGLKKLLGLYNVTNPIVAKERDGEKFIQYIESCKRFNEKDPNCMLGKTITESSGIPFQKAGIDESKQTISISPTALVQKLMEHKKAEESTPDAVVNNIQPLTKSSDKSSKPEIQSSEINNNNNNNKNEASTANNDQPNLDPNTLLALLSAALGNNAEKTGSSSKRGNEIKTTTNQTDQIETSFIAENIPKNCTKLFKRGFTINYNCNDLISNKTQVRVKGGELLSTTDLVQKLLDSKEMNDVTRKAIPPAHLQKTSNGFQVKFDLHVKDQIPTEVSGTLKTLSSGRQQHVNIFNTPKGMFMKPKSSVQLLQPSFVPVKQNKDNIELIEPTKKRFY